MTQRSDIQQASPPTCAFCDATKDLLLCDWLRPGWAKTPLLSLSVGDKVYRGKLGKHLLRRLTGTVQSVSTDEWGIMVKATFGDWQDASIRGGPRKRVLAFVPAPCGQWCCPLHRVERGEFPHAYCRDHWMAWTTVA